VVNGGMRKRNSVQGVIAQAPRPTKAAAIMLATAMSIPVFFVLSLIEWLLF
jgi:hypothetical protein